MEASSLLGHPLSAHCGGGVRHEVVHGEAATLPVQDVQPHCRPAFALSWPELHVWMTTSAGLLGLQS